MQQTSSTKGHFGNFRKSITWWIFLSSIGFFYLSHSFKPRSIILAGNCYNCRPREYICTPSWRKNWGIYLIWLLMPKIIFAIKFFSVITFFSRAVEIANFICAGKLDIIKHVFCIRWQLSVNSFFAKNPIFLGPKCCNYFQRHFADKRSGLRHF